MKKFEHYTSCNSCTMKQIATWEGRCIRGEECGFKGCQTTEPQMMRNPPAPAGKRPGPPDTVSREKKYRRVEYTIAGNPYEKIPDEKVQGYFHGWCHDYEVYDDGPAHHPCAIIELDDGSVVVRYAGFLRFLEPLSKPHPCPLIDSPE